ncbi:hypothetical protein INT45_007716 [Circinella minor]|uniref:Uncharacterized protein n=1 Tax=Circinella minor TaxID=1195481 RepID=A0A8H7RW94_9FUNG|nr:hypothetical protein INT45_007716 [Circinella minor]
MDFESEIDMPSWSLQLQKEQEQNRHSLYTPSMFITENLEQNHYIPITAIVDRVTKDEQAVYHSVQHLLKYPFIKEIYINNNKFSRRPLSMELFQDLNFNRTKHDHIQLYIIQQESSSLPSSSSSSSSILSTKEYDISMTRFTTCMKATYSHCYFQDDLGLNLYMDTQYTNFLQTPHLIHANARPATFIDHQKWRFKHGNDLHVGYAQFRYGTIVQKSLIESFVSTVITSYEEQQEQHLDHHADINFIIWSNQYPWLLSNPLLTTGKNEFNINNNNGDDDDSIDPINNRKYVYRYMYEALQGLEKRLSEQSHEAANPPLKERHVRTSCANDHCLFTTNINPFDPEEIQNQREFTIPNVTSIQDWESSFIGKIPSTEMWQRGAYHYAVDNNPYTCWNSFLHPRKGDYFGLNMVGTIPAKRILVHLQRPIMDYNFEEEKEQGAFFKISVSEKKDQWIDCRVERMKEMETSKRIALRLQDCSNIKAWNAIRLEFKKDLLEPIQICGIHIDNMIV